MGGHAVAVGLCAATLLSVLLLLVASQTTQASKATAAAGRHEFVSLVPACACGHSTVLAAFSLQNGRRLATITPVTTTLGELLTLSSGPSGEVIETATRPPLCTSNLADCGPERDTCRGQMSVLAGNTLRAIFTAPDSVELQYAIGSPDRRRLAMIAEPCTSGTVSVVVRDIRTGSQSSIASLPRCSTLGAPAWSSNGRQLVFPFARARATPSLPAPLCSTPPYARLAIASAVRPSPPAAWISIAADRGCSFEAATFDASGIAAVEGCRRASVPDSVTFPGFGQAVLVELNHRHQITQRIDLQPGWEEGVITTEPSGDVLISQDQPANEPYPERDWVWELHNHNLRLIASYKALDAAEIIAVPR